MTVGDSKKETTLVKNVRLGTFVDFGQRSESDWNFDHRAYKLSCSLYHKTILLL